MEPYSSGSSHYATSSPPVLPASCAYDRRLGVLTKFHPARHHQPSAAAFDDVLLLGGLAANLSSFTESRSLAFPAIWPASHSYTSSLEIWAWMGKTLHPHVLRGESTCDLLIGNCLRQHVLRSGNNVVRILKWLASAAGALNRSTPRQKPIAVGNYM